MKGIIKLLIGLVLIAVIVFYVRNLDSSSNIVKIQNKSSNQYSSIALTGPDGSTYVVGILKPYAERILRVRTRKEGSISITYVRLGKTVIKNTDSYITPGTSQRITVIIP